MELDLKDLLELLWRKALWIILSILFGGALMFCLAYFLMTPIYSATASMYVYNTNRMSMANGVSQSDLMASQKLVDTYIVILKSDSVLSKVADKVNIGYNADQIRKMLSASSTNGTEAFSVTIDNPDKVHAQKIVNTIAEVAPSEIVRVVKAGSVEVIDYAKIPEKPSSPNIPIYTVVGALLGAILSVLAIILTKIFDTTIHTENDMGDFNIPLLGVIPSLTHQMQK